MNHPDRNSGSQGMQASVDRSQPGEIERRLWLAPEPAVRRTVGIAAVSLVVVVAFYLLREHWGHALGLLPYLLLLACPLLHLFHGHDGHHHAADDQDRRDP